MYCVIQIDSDIVAIFIHNHFESPNILLANFLYYILQREVITLKHDHEAGVF
jgi:hypothetical protein